MRRLGCVITLLLAILAPAAPAHAQLATVETPQVRLVYFDGTESYLVPHVARAFLNALAVRARGSSATILDEPITVLLADFSDAGNAAAGTVPRNLMAIQIAPLNFAFETIAANERMTTLMDHELVHVVTMDQAVGRDRVVPASVPGQGHADRRAPRVAPVLVSDRAARRRRRGGITRGSRSSSIPGWPAVSAARRAATTRWSSARWSETTCPSTIRWASCRKARRSISRRR